MNCIKNSDEEEVVELEESVVDLFVRLNQHHASCLELRQVL
jgi:hypothetical protein